MHLRNEKPSFQHWEKQLTCLCFGAVVYSEIRILALPPNTDKIKSCHLGKECADRHRCFPSLLRLSVPPWCCTWVSRLALSGIPTVWKRGKCQVPIKPRSKAAVRLLTLMKKPGYAGKFEIIHDHCAVQLVESLTGRLRKCGVTSPRFDVQLKDLEKWQNGLLPSRQFVFIVPTTSVGIMDHEEARWKHRRENLWILFQGI